MPKFHKVNEKDGREMLVFRCPGCEENHAVWVGSGSPSWTFNGDVDRPTCKPSLMVRMGPKCDKETGLALPGEKDRVCHSYIIEGTIQFLGDCTHSMAGKIVSIPEWA